MDSRRLPIGIRWIAVLLLVCAHGAVMAQGAWHLDRIDEFQAPRFNSPDAPDNGRDPYCPGHRIDIGPGRDSQNFVITQVIPGSCHNRGGYRGVFSYRHFWTAPPARLLAGRQMPFRLGSKVVTVENAPFGTGASGVMAGFLDYDQANGPYGPGSNEPVYKIASIAAEGPPDTEASFDNERSERPFVMPPHPAFGSDRNDGRIRFRIWTSHVYPWRAVDYVYRWVADGADQAIMNTSHKGSASVPSLLGTWSWTCCRGRHRDTFTVTEHRSDGTIRGVFGSGQDGNSTPFQGTFKAGVMQFTRHLDIAGRKETQEWRARIQVQGDVMQTVDGRWSGYAATADNNDFHARLGAGQPSVKQQPWPTQLPVVTPAGVPRVAALTWLGMDEDRVGELGNGKPNGTRDGRFRLVLEAEGRFAISSLSVWSANERGEKTGGQVWHTKNGSYWMLGVFRDGRQLNASHVDRLGEFTGRVVLDLYANSSGWFNPGQWFLLEMEGTDGRVVRQTLRLGDAPEYSSAGLPNLARGKPASQSSTSEWSRSNDAQGAVDGVINGSYAFHTGNQANPWWQVDLGGQASIDEVRIFNRLDCCAERARTLQVMLSDDGRQWRTVYRHGGDLFGGRDGKPLKVALRGASARFVRLQLNEANWFHLDEVEVYGRMEDSISMPGGRDYTGDETPQTSQSSTSPSTGNTQADSLLKEVDGLLDAVNSLKGLFGK
jgi:hypothetical protein